MPFLETSADLVLVEPVYTKYESLLQDQYRQEGILGLPLLEQAMLEASLNERGSDGELLLLAASLHGRHVVGSFEFSQLPFLRELYEACHDVWIRPPWADSRYSIERVVRQGYSGPHLVILVNPPSLCQIHTPSTFNL
jgi:hypothetical protein